MRDIWDTAVSLLLDNVYDVPITIGQVTIPIECKFDEVASLVPVKDEVSGDFDINLNFTKGLKRAELILQPVQEKLDALIEDYPDLYNSWNHLFDACKVAEHVMEYLNASDDDKQAFSMFLSFYESYLSDSYRKDVFLFNPSNKVRFIPGNRIVFESVKGIVDIPTLEDMIKAYGKYINP